MASCSRAGNLGITACLPLSSHTSNLETSTLVASLPDFWHNSDYSETCGPSVMGVITSLICVYLSVAALSCCCNKQARNNFKNTYCAKHKSQIYVWSHSRLKKRKHNFDKRKSLWMRSHFVSHSVLSLYNLWSGYWC